MTPATTLFGAPVDLEHANPQVVASRLLAHVAFRDDLPMRGEQEALGGWDMTQPQRISGPAWTPGSRSLREPNPTWAILDSGMAQLA
jgi:hypothetical protein